MPSSLRGGGDQPKSSGRNITGNIEIAGLWNLVAEDTDAAISVYCGSNKEIIKYHFHMIPGRHRLDDRSFALGKEASQQQCAFQLRACHRHSIPNPAQ